MKHGRFLAAISFLLSSSFCAAVNPPYKDQLRALERILESFDKDNKVSATEDDLDKVEQILEGDSRFDPRKANLKYLYGKLYSLLKNKKFFSRTYNGYVVFKCSDKDRYVRTIGELADRLLIRRIDGYQNANQYSRDCCHFVMCEVLKII